MTTGSAQIKVLLAGDTHGDLSQVRYLLTVAADQGIDRIVQVGDFGYWPHMEPFHERVGALALKAGIDFYWLDGNHENFDALEADVDINCTEPWHMTGNLWYLPRGSTWEWDGCRFMALGGAYSIDKAYRTPGRSWWAQELLTREQVERAMDRGPVDVLLTHDAPDGVCPIISTEYKGDEISRGNRLAVTAVMEAVQPRLLVHGHYHHRYGNKIGRTQIEGLDRDGTGPLSWLVIEPQAWAVRPSTEAGDGMTDSLPATAAPRDWPCTNADHLGLCSDDHIHADHSAAPTARWHAGDTVLNPVSGYTFTAVRNHDGGLQWLELAPTAAYAQDEPPAGAVLLVRWVDGKPLPVVNLTDGELYGIRSVQ